MRWHLAVVAASHNELLSAVMSALADAVHAGSDIADLSSEPVRRAALAAHDRVVDAIRAGDAEAAFRRMHRRLHAFRIQVEPTIAGPAAVAPVPGRRRVEAR